MQFLYDLAAQAGDNFKETADAVWDALGESHKGSKTLREAQRTAGKYALTATMAMMMNYPDNAELFRDTFNVTGPGPTGAGEFMGDKELESVGRLIGRGSVVAGANNSQAQMMNGFADVTATSTLSDIQNMLPMLMLVGEQK